MRTRSTLILTLLGVLALPLAAHPQEEMAEVRIEAVPVAEGIYMLTGRGGNLGLSVGPDGAFLVDDQYAPLTERILAAIREVTDGEVRFVLNTHWHGDHTGGNENLGKAGVLIVAHENVRKRMSVEQFMEAFDRTVPAAPPDALPVITFNDRVTFHWNGQTIRTFHVARAHTDGDVLVHFQEADVFHMGDTFFNGSYPFVDVGSGGTIRGMIRAAERVLAHATNDTKIIPGHGPLATPDDLRAYLDMLRTVEDRIRTLVNEGRSKEEVLAARPTADLDAEWGGGFMSPERFVGLVYDGMTGYRPHR